MGRIRKISSIVITVSIAFFAIGGVATVFLNRPTSSWKALNVATGSMRPGMPPGSLVIVHRVPDSTLKVGDVITYAKPGNVKETISHRIIAFTAIGKGRAVITKGDANQLPDQPILTGQVVGKRVANVPVLGKAISWTRTLPGLIVLIYLPALLIIIEEIKNMAKYYKEQMPYRESSFERRLQAAAKHGHNTLVAGGAAAAVLLVGAVIAFSTAQAVAVSGQMSNTVALAPNTLFVATGGSGGGTGGGTTTCTNHNTVNVHNSSNQTATSGGASSTGNTTGGSATSGSAGNSNSGSTTITITNGC